MQTVLKCDNAISCANVMAAMKDFVVWKKINYAYIVLGQNRFILPNYLLLWIFLNMKRHCVSYIRIEKCLMAAFMKMNGSWILISLPTLFYLSLICWYDFR